ncbi:hypothetical protein QA645_17075 [Bradyrhizobium sp. CIAT3101]|uniref:hypothetical protein n=1 Tax=Bradyrhizobium sp. CIAT3101 TaxID=439387 RepID=UPI0024B1FC86|nr:hypothetical protein [Bradyrhizobium sp. CIAT3101]WFU84385.1 hypothetical protein QA645_17075 [Bradyrhizobium sp. CIAT3101]
MQSITELAAVRAAAWNVVGNVHIPEEDAQKFMIEVFAAEAAILSTSISTREDKIIARDILYEGGEIDFADSFKEQLTLRLLHAI